MAKGRMGPPPRGSWRTYFCAVLVLVLGSLLYLWGHVKSMSQGEDLSRLRSERLVLIRKQDRLRAEVAGLKRSSRIREIATEKLGMVFPSDPPLNLYLQPADSGRTRGGVVNAD